LEVVALYRLAKLFRCEVVKGTGSLLSCALGEPVGFAVGFGTPSDYF
jgi:hypothetical protein